MNNTDLRYHVASLSAIFLALGIGIVIGTAFVGSPLVSRQTGMLHRLETHVTELREETRERERTEEALAQLLPQAIRGTLRGKRVLVVQMGNYADATLAATETLTLAGAIPMTVQLPPDAWRARLNMPDVAPDRIADEARKLATRLASGATDFWGEYRESGLLISSDREDSLAGAVGYVVLVGGETGGGDTTLLVQRDLPLIEEWQSAGLTVVAVEPRKTEISYLPTYRGKGIATIDAIDRAAGKIALPFALSGETGAFGYRTDAGQILPPIVGSEPSPDPSPAPTATPKVIPILPSPGATQPQ
ncbi:MAG: copper transporter [Akkermansiaceae bacterium]|nr:copper transporter [Armatimonadota bacterium]